jgi:hypothetical protein
LLVNTLLTTSQEMCARSRRSGARSDHRIASGRDGVDPADEDSVTVSLSARGLLSLAAGQWRVRLASHEECRRIAAVIDAVTAQPGIGARR